jgi:hypothetical protein
MWPPTLTACECEQAGWCERHQCQKTPEWHLLCRRQETYFQLWEHGQGPCLNRFLRDQQSPAEGAAEVLDAEQAADPEGPGLLRRAWNFGQAVVRHAADGAAKVSDAVYEERLGICRQCELCNLDRMVCSHPACGCFLTIKAGWNSEKCPLDKWMPITPNTSHASEKE